MSQRSTGLPDNWLDRDAAEQSMYESSDSVPDQANPLASKVASKPATVPASTKEGDGEKKVTTAVQVPQPAPPPAKQREIRVQFNHRILEKRDRLLQSYKRKHNTTMQAIVDQMVDEYLERRGLLPKDED